MFPLRSLFKDQIPETGIPDNPRQMPLLKYHLSSQEQKALT